MKGLLKRLPFWGRSNKASHPPVKNHRYAQYSIVLFCIAAIIGVGQSGAGLVFKDATPNLLMVFPRDHGKHPDFETEWWYFTGNLESGDTNWGFQLTFFRRSLFNERAPMSSSWAVRDIYPAHFALTDATNRRFFHAELLSREGPGLAGAAEDDLNVWVKDWTARRQGQDIVIKANGKRHSLDLLLSPEKDLVLHGEAGYSRKGDTPSQASHYYSFTRLRAAGTLTFEGQSYKVSGLGWMDHEFGSSLLTQNQAGWDWFSLQLEDGTEFMIFHLRNKDGTFERPFGSFVPTDGKPMDLAGKQINILAKGSWVSPNTQARYPSGWTIDIPEKEVILEIEPFLDNQELVTAKSTQVIYWEGAVKVKGFREGKPVAGKGYVELTGYCEAMAGRL
jgi:predicted secreted hydrolase